MNPERRNRHGGKHRPSWTGKFAAPPQPEAIDSDLARTQAEALTVIARRLDSIERSLNGVRDELRELRLLTQPNRKATS